MSRLASPLLNISFPKSDTGAFLIRSARRYHHFKNTMGMRPSHSYINFLGRVRKAGGSVKMSGLALSTNRVARFGRGVAKGAFAKGHSFFGNQYTRFGKSVHFGPSSVGMTRASLRGLVQTKHRTFARREESRAFRAALWTKRLVKIRIQN